jgi:guanylate kinase/SAM-dependent methyltransferase
MSILSYIKNPIPFILISGPSGIGKTTLIENLLIENPDYFEVPLSYTSRKKRNDTDRYVFVTEDAIKKMHNDGQLINLDYVHGDYYGIYKGTIDAIKKKGKIPVKEIHPQNFEKFKSKGIDSITILLENKHLNSNTIFIKRENRKDEEFDFDKYSDYDIKLNIAGLDPKAASAILIKKIIAFRIHLSKYPHPNVIDQINYIGYSKIAEEFTESLRVTTKNFHDISIPFWKKNLDKYKPNNLNKYATLELGPGNGWLFTTITMPSLNIYGVDISPNMRCDYCEQLFITSSRNIPCKSNFFDVVVASLADPLLTPESFIEIERVLKPGGEFIFTIPSAEWAMSLGSRNDLNQTTFKLLSGEEVNVYSFCDALLNHLYISSVCDLKIIGAENLYIDDSYSETISSAITEASKNSAKRLDMLPVVLGVICKKYEQNL